MSPHARFHSKDVQETYQFEHLWVFLLFSGHRTHTDEGMAEFSISHYLK